MEKISVWIHKFTGLEAAFQARIGTSLAILFILWLARTFLIRLVWRLTEDAHVRYRWRKIFAYISIFLAVILLLPVWFRSSQSLITILGFLTAGLAIALQDLIKCLAGWAFILWRRPFDVGDRIEVGDIKGDVIDMRAFQFTLMEIGNWVDADQSTGRVIHVPNSRVLSDVLANYSQGFHYIWNEIPVLVTFESDWRTAKELLLEIAKKRSEHLTRDAEKKVKEASKQYWIFYKTLTPIVYSSVEECGVLLTIRYLTEPRQRRNSENNIWEDILDAFKAKGNIDFAYPTNRFYNNSVEGKTELKKTELR